MQLPSLIPLALLTALVSAAAVPAAQPQNGNNHDWKKREALPMADVGAFLEERAAATVGGVRFLHLPSQRVCSHKLSDLHLHGHQLGRNLWLQGAAPQYLHQSRQRLVSTSLPPTRV
jgi:hypothetical protein